MSRTSSSYTISYMGSEGTPNRLAFSVSTALATFRKSSSGSFPIFGESPNGLSHGTLNQFALKGSSLIEERENFVETCNPVFLNSWYPSTSGLIKKSPG